MKQLIFGQMLLSSIFMWGAIALADGTSADENAHSELGAVTMEEDVRDPRLPPALPGESMKDGTRSMKVWSTAGGLVGTDVPQAPAPNNCNRTDGSRCEDLPENLSIVVDERNERLGRN